MDDDLEAIYIYSVYSRRIRRILWFKQRWRGVIALVQDDESCENILPFNFDVALSVIEGDHETMEEEIAEALITISIPDHLVSFFKRALHFQWQ